MSGIRPRAIPVLKKVAVRPSDSSLSTRGDSQSNIYKKTTTTTVVQKGSGYGQPQGTRGLRPPGADTRSAQATPRYQQAPRGIPTPGRADLRSMQTPSRYGRAPEDGMSSIQTPSGMQSRLRRPSPNMPDETARGMLPPREAMGQGGMTPRNVPGPGVGGRRLQMPRALGPSVRTAAYDSGTSESSVSGYQTGAIPKNSSKVMKSKTTTKVGSDVVSNVSTTRVESTVRQQNGPESSRPYRQRRDDPRSQQYGSRTNMDATPQNYPDYQSGMMRMDTRKPSRAQARQPRSVNADYQDTSMSEEDWNTSSRTLEEDVESTLLETASYRPKTSMKAVGARRSMTSTPMIMTDHGAVPGKTQIISTKTITKTPGQPDIVGRDLIGIEEIGPGQAEKTEISIQRLTPRKIHSKTQSPRSREVVTVKSSTTVGSGIKQTVKTVIYEGDPSDIQKTARKPSPQDVERMVAEETALINETLALRMPEVQRISPTNYPVRKKSEGYAIDKEAISSLKLMAMSPKGSDMIFDTDEPTPEMIANMMNTEERGLTMSSPPANLYNYLFSDSHVDPVIEVTSVAPTPLQDVVVPMSNQIPDQGQDLARDSEVMNIMLAAEKNTDELNESTYCSIVGDEPLQSKNTAKKGKKSKRTRVTLLTQEVPPWGIQDVGPIIDVVGAPLAETKVIPEESQQEIDPALEGIEYILQMETPKHYSQVQLRGAQNPSWFPGYLMALPDSPNLISIAKSPSDVFTAAWRATQPDIFDDKSLFVV